MAMYRERFSTSASPADFPGALVQLTRPKQMCVEHVDYPNQASLHRRMLPKLVSMLNSFITFTRSSIAILVNEAGLIENVPVDTARQDYDPITLQKKYYSSRRLGRTWYQGPMAFKLGPLQG